MDMLVIAGGFLNELGSLTPGMQDIRRDAAARKVLLEVQSEEDIRRLGLGIGHDAVISVFGGPSKRRRQGLEVVFLGRYRFALEVVVTEPDRRQPVPGAAEVDDAGGPWSCLVGRLLEKRQEKIREQEGSDVVGSELPFYSFRRLLTGIDHDACVVHQDV